MAGHLDLRLLGQFLVICQAGKMTEAARLLGLSTPAVSQIVHRLERDLGVVLFERGSRGLRPTPAGSLLQERSRALLGSEAELLGEMEGYRAQLLPRLRLYVAESIATYIIAAIVPELRQSVGELEVRSGRSSLYLQDFLRGTIDVLISSEALEDVPRLDRFPLCSEELVALVPAGVPAARRELPELARALPFIRPSRGSRIDALVERFLGREGLDPPRGIECGSPAPTVAMVEAGLGWTISTPLSLAHFRPDPARTAFVALPSPRPLRTLFLVANSGRLLDVPASLAQSCRTALEAAVDAWPRNLRDAVRFSGDPLPAP